MRISNHFIAYLIVLSNTLNAMAIDVHLPSLPKMVNDLHTTEFKVQMVLTIFYIGAIFSRLFWGPMSDFFGRKDTLLCAYAIQIAAQLGCVLAPSIDFLILMRLLQSFGSGVTGVIGTAIISDLFNGIERAKMLSLVELSFPLAFVIAPSVGVIISSFFGWRGSFAFVLVTLVISFLLFYIFLKKDTSIINTFKLEKINFIFSDYIKLITEKNIILYSTLIGISASLYMSFAIHSPFIFLVHFNVSKTEYAIYHTFPLIVSFIFTLLYKKTLTILGIKKSLKLGIICCALLVFMVFFILLANINLGKILILCISCVCSMFSPYIIISGTALALEAFPQKRGMSSSIISSMRSFYVGIAMIFSSYFFF